MTIVHWIPRRSRDQLLDSVTAAGMSFTHERARVTCPICRAAAHPLADGSPVDDDQGECIDGRGHLPLLNGSCGRCGQYVAYVTTPEVPGLVEQYAQAVDDQVQQVLDERADP